MEAKMMFYMEMIIVTIIVRELSEFAYVNVHTQNDVHVLRIYVSYTEEKIIYRFMHKRRHC